MTIWILRNPRGVIESGQISYNEYAGVYHYSYVSIYGSGNTWHAKTLSAAKAGWARHFGPRDGIKNVWEKHIIGEASEQ